MPATKARVGDSSQKGSPVAGRKREREPDPRTVEGQWALWFRSKLPSDFKVTEFAEAIGKDRSMVFKWLRGESVPHVSVWDDIARELGLPGWWSLCPPEAFIRSLGAPKRGRWRP